MSFDPVTMAMARPKVVDMGAFTFVYGDDFSKTTRFESLFIELFNLSVQNGTVYSASGYDYEGELRKTLSTTKPIVLKFGADLGYGDVETYVPAMHTIREEDGKITEMSGRSILWVGQLNALVETKCYVRFDPDGNSNAVSMSVWAEVAT